MCVHKRRVLASDIVEGEAYYKLFTPLQMLREDAGGFTTEPGIGVDDPAGPTVRPSLRLDHVSAKSLHAAACARRTGNE